MEAWRERDVEEAPDGLRRSRWWAVAALLLLLTSVWLPWWLVRYESQGVRYEESRAGLFLPAAPLTNEWGPHVTGVLVGAALLLLFVRVAGRSWLYEPGTWRRDLALIAGGLLLALASTLLWPAAVPSFWGGRTYDLANATGSFTQTALPGLGWWCAVLACACSAAGWWQARAPSTRDPANRK